MKPKLSILTPSIWSRADQAQALADKIAKQAKAHPVEHIVLFDNRHSSVGHKRNACLRAARGDYVVFVDDDDDISDKFIPSILKAIQSEPHFVTYRQKVIWNGIKSHVVFHPQHTDEPLNPGGETKRNLWHVCTWRRELVQDCIFPDCNNGEDLAWSLQARRRVRRGVHINKVLHEYRHDANLSAATGNG
jgi:glycosyltransferase involved in cell wall biosynthesis